MAQGTHRRRLRGRGCDDDRIVHRVILFEGGLHLRYCRSLLADGHVDATTSLPWLMIVSSATAVLPVWRSPIINSPGRPIGIIASIALRPVCSGSFALGGRRCPARCARPACTTLQRSGLAVGRLAERVDHAPDHGVAGQLDDSLGAFDDVAFLDRLKLAEQDRADLVLFEVERESGRAFSNSSSSRPSPFPGHVSAIPSPTLITVPTSATVTPASKFSICRRMILLISSALISFLHYINLLFICAIDF